MNWVGSTRFFCWIQCWNLSTIISWFSPTLSRTWYIFRSDIRSSNPNNFRSSSGVKSSNLLIHTDWFNLLLISSFTAGINDPLRPPILPSTDSKNLFPNQFLSINATFPTEKVTFLAINSVNLPFMLLLAKSGFKTIWKILLRILFLPSWQDIQ